MAYRFQFLMTRALPAALFTFLTLAPVAAKSPPAALTYDELLEHSDQAKFQGNPEDALDYAAAAHKMRPDGLKATQAVEQRIQDGLPDTVSPETLAAIPVATSAIGGGLGTVASVSAYLPCKAQEPQHDWTFDHETYIYLKPATGSDGELKLFCRVHYTVPGDTRLAERMGSLLAIAHHAWAQKTGAPTANADAPFNVWLCRGGQSGGEQWRDNLYLYDLDAPRSSIEWIREIIHEYSHLAVPAIGGYTDPEYWANGYLGERLIVRWIQRTPGMPALVESAWGDFSGAANFDKLLIDPAIALYKKNGRSKTWLDRRDELGMRYFIGQMLTVDDKYGARTLAAAFGRLPRFREARASDMADALAEVVPAQPPVRTTRSAHKPAGDSGASTP
ncbi:hypothetical protein [Capsulimonas corticalis]|nr:hypothetical protein [Capsulimonas corticalis]